MLLNMLRSFGFWIDSIIYWFISLLYELFLLIGKAKIFSIDTVDKFYDRIYVLVGVFMLFKISFSLLTMIADPEKLTDKNAGIGKITTRVFVSLVMLLFMPTVFKTAYSLQDQIVESNILAKVIIGVQEESQLYNTSIGKTLSFSTFRAFFYPIRDDSGEEIFIDKQTTRDTWHDAERKADVSKLGDIINEKQNGEYIFEYKGIISTIAGGFVAFVLISFCIDIGVRCVKLGFLQIIAPIPIISYIDPKSSQDGAFNKWVRTLAITYLDLFIRLLIIFFVVFILGAVDSVNVSDNFVLNGFVQVFVILGALMFAKQAPGLIKDMLGIKGDVAAFGELNPLKKIRGAAGAKAAGFLAGHATGGLMSLARGKGFSTGWSSGTKGQFKDMSKAHLDKSQAKKEVRDRDEDERKGAEFYSTKDSGGNPFKGGNANKFNESVDKVGNAKNNMYAAQNKKNAAEQNYNAQVQRRTQLQTQLGQAEANVRNARNSEEAINAQKTLDILNAQMSVANTDFDVASRELIEANKMAGTAEGIYNDAKAAHDKLRASDATNAKIQDQMDLYELVNVKTSKVSSFVDNE